MRAYKSNMIPGGITPKINVSQYDNDYAVTVTLFEGTEIYTPPVGATIRVEGTKPDGHGFEYPCTYQGNVVTMPIYTQMTVVSGRFPIELVVYQNGLRVGSCNIIFAVEKAPLGEDTDISETVIPDIIDAAQSSAEAAAEAADAAATSAASVVDSATAAAASATQAAASATSASASATTASSAATNAVSARDAAIEAAGDAETSSNAAATSESNAAASATAAATSESNAAASATAAAASSATASSAATNAVSARNAAIEAAQAAAQSAASLTVDTELSSTSTNPVQNKVIDATVTELKNDLYQFADIENELVFEVAFSKNVRKNTLIKSGTRISITGGVNTNGAKVSFLYADGTRDTTIEIRTGINYRPTKDVIAISIYNGDTETHTYTCVLYANELNVTNYFDKSAKIDGYITNSGNVASGYYHSDYIPVALGDTIIASSYPSTFGSARMFFFDANKTFKGYCNGTLREDGFYTFTIPLSTIGSEWVIGDIYYAAFNITDDIGSETAKFYINAVPNLPLEYGQNQPEAGLYFNKQQYDLIESKETNAKEYSDAQLAQIVTHEVSANIFNINDPLVEINTIWQNSGKTTLNGYLTTAPIPVKTGDVLLYNKPTSDLYSNFAAYVTENKTFISKIATPSSTTSEGYTQITANRDGFISFNCSVNAATQLMITKNAPMPESYEQYKDEYEFTDKVNVGGGSGSGESLLKGKLIAYNGDSICESRLQETNSYNGGAYAKIIADTVNGSYENRAISGGILASAVPSGENPRRFVVTDVQNMTDDADLICFEGGINDYWRNVPLGDYSESDYTGTLDTTTICGALESIFRQATAKWVGKPILFVIVHKIKSTVYVANTAGYTFAQAREKMIGICNKYAIPYYDAFAESGLNAYNDIQNTTFLTSNSSGNPDGCHPNEAAYRRYYVPQLIALFESLMPRLEE